MNNENRAPHAVQKLNATLFTALVAYSRSLRATRTDDAQLNSAKKYRASMFSLIACPYTQDQRIIHLINSL